MLPRPSRLPVNRVVRIVLGQYGEGIPARVLDVSKSGACLTSPDSGCVPDAFDLLDVFSGTTRKSKVVWRGEHAMGVMFVDTAPWPEDLQEASASSPLAVRTRDRK